MHIKEVRWKNGAVRRGVDAEAAHKELEHLRLEGRLTDQDVVDRARDKKNVLHPLFEWNDGEAAARYRRVQAREIIRSIEVTYQEAPAAKVRAFQVATKSNKPTERRTIYSSTSEMMQDPEARDRLIARAIREAMEFRRKFQHLRELQVVIEAIDSFVEKVGAEPVN